MRYLGIPGFPKLIEISDLEHTVRTRLSQGTVVWPEQGLPLVGYMAYPNDSDARVKLLATVDAWFSGSSIFPDRMLRMQLEWLRIGDILNVHYDLFDGGHQHRRGGPSVGKAITLVAAQTRVRGCSEANLWATWKRYKDVAHLVAAAIMITGDVRERAKRKLFGEYGLRWEQIRPFFIAMMLPEIVLSVGLHLQEYCLEHIPHGGDEPMLAPETIWRIPHEINLVPMPPPIRNINREAIQILNQRRAGNRGK